LPSRPRSRCNAGGGKAGSHGRRAAA
jgi:hypothetical protein